MCGNEQRNTNDPLPTLILMNGQTMERGSVVIGMASEVGGYVRRRVMVVVVIVEMGVDQRRRDGDRLQNE